MKAVRDKLVNEDDPGGMWLFCGLWIIPRDASRYVVFRDVATIFYPDNCEDVQRGVRAVMREIV